LLIFFSVLPINSFNEVFPQLPVIAMILLSEFSLTTEDVSVKNFKLSFTLICLEKFFNLSMVLTTAKEAPLLNASFTNKFPFLFFPLIAKNMSFFFISFEFIDAFLIFVFREKFIGSLTSLKILSFEFPYKFLFFIFIYFKIVFLSEKKFLLSP